MIITNTYQWPDEKLWPNQKKKLSWRVVNPIKARARDVAEHVTDKVYIPHMLKTQQFILKYDFYPPDNKRYDMDNAINACKPIVDGACKKLGLDDYYAFNGLWSRMPAVSGGKKLINHQVMEGMVVISFIWGKRIVIEDLIDVDNGLGD